MELTELNLRKYIATFMDKPHTNWPKIREIAKRYKTTQQVIIDMVEECDILDLIVGIRAGTGIGEFEKIGDYQIEHVEADQLFIKAEVFRIIRNNSDRPKKAILKCIHKHLPDISNDRISKALKELGNVL